MADSDEDRFSDWEENEDDDCGIIDLFSSKVFPSVREFLEFNQQNQFDILDIIARGNCDEIGIIMLINFIRSQVKEESREIGESFKNLLKEKIFLWEFRADEKYMRPVLPDDTLLFLLGEYVVDNQLSSTENKGDQEWESDRTFGHIFDKVSAVAEPVKSASEIESIRQNLSNLTEIDVASRNAHDTYIGDYYFDGYSHIGIHETMLRDAARTNAYGEAIQKNADFIKGKVVLDIGCGTGILSLFAARAGAAKVVGVDCSAIALKAQQIVKRNGYDDVITIVRGQLEEVDLPLEEGEVDIIVSEWMGYGLYYENMLPAVLYARDKYMKGFSGKRSEDGEQKSPSIASSKTPSPAAMMPSNALLYLEAASSASSLGSAEGETTAKDDYDGDRVGWWKDVYGFDMRDMTHLFTAEAQVDLAAPEAIISDRARIHDLQVISTIDSDLDFNVPFELHIKRTALLRSFVISFDVTFTDLRSDEPSEEVVVVTLPTGVQHTPTHWKQVMCWLNPENVSEVTEGTVVTGTVCYTRLESNKRDYDIRIAWTTTGDDSSVERSQQFVLAS